MKLRQGVYSAAALDDFGMPLWIGEESQALFERAEREALCRLESLLFEAVAADDAILMWPVTILGETEDHEGTRLHITLNWTKWAGSADELLTKVKTLLAGASTRLPHFDEWKPEVFQGREGKSFHVLTVPALQSFVVGLRKRLETVFADTFGPGYKPHITVAPELQKRISQQHATPREAMVRVEPLELRLGNKVVAQLDARVGLSRPKKEIQPAVKALA